MQVADNKQIDELINKYSYFDFIKFDFFITPMISTSCKLQAAAVLRSSCLHLPVCMTYLLILSLHVSCVQFSKDYPTIPAFLAPPIFLASAP